MNMLLAQAGVNIGDTPLGKGSISGTYPNLGTLISLILKNSLTVAGILLLFLLLFGGVTYIMSAGDGDPKKAQQAQTAITDALIGFAVVFLAYFIIQIIQVITGLNILNPNF